MSATLIEKSPLDIMAQSKVEESIVMAMYLKTKRQWQMVIGVASLFMYLRGPLSSV